MCLGCRDAPPFREILSSLSCRGVHLPFPLLWFLPLPLPLSCLPLPLPVPGLLLFLSSVPDYPLDDRFVETLFLSPGVLHIVPQQLDFILGGDSNLSARAKITSCERWAICPYMKSMSQSFRHSLSCLQVCQRNIDLLQRARQSSILHEPRVHIAPQVTLLADRRRGEVESNRNATKAETLKKKNTAPHCCDPCLFHPKMRDSSWSATFPLKNRSQG